MVVGCVIVRVTVIIYPTSRIGNERGVVVLDGGVGSTHPLRRLTELSALRRREPFDVRRRGDYKVDLRGSGSVLERPDYNSRRNRVGPSEEGDGG